MPFERQLEQRTSQCVCESSDKNIFKHFQDEKMDYENETETQLQGVMMITCPVVILSGSKKGFRVREFQKSRDFMGRDREVRHYYLLAMWAKTGS